MFDTSWLERRAQFTRSLLWTAGGLVLSVVALAFLYAVWPRRVQGSLYADGGCSAIAAGALVAERNIPYLVSRPAPSVVELECGGGNVRLYVGVHPDTGLVVGTFPVRAARHLWPAPGEAEGVARAPSAFAGFLGFASFILSDMGLRSMWGRMRIDRLEGTKPVGSFTFWARPGD
jgi:hypothetical protein